MEKTFCKFVLILIIAALLFENILSQTKNGLHITSENEVGQIEVGSPYVGIEIHNSFPMLNRISFYYPVANSIDISKDYWKRENYRVMSVGYKIDNSSKRISQNEVYKVDQTPYLVSFSKNIEGLNFLIKYEFCKNEPAFVITYKIKNVSPSVKDVEFYTRLETVLRTSHTYNMKDKAYTEFDSVNSSINYYYNDVETGYAKLSIINAESQPSSFTTKSLNSNESNSLDSLWLNRDAQFSNELISVENPARPAAALIYNKTIKPEEELKIVQILVSSKIGDDNKAAYLKGNYKDEISDYKKYIEDEANNDRNIKTGDNVIDYSVKWAKAILAANMHYIDEEIVPMPAQAEYNFYFTHDVLLTDLAIVNYDYLRVRNDLEFIINHARDDNNIPHAYYWKDSSYITEYAGSENWNHFWFTIIASRYLRHTNDIEFANTLYPYVKKSIETAMLNKNDDGLMWSFRPDWFDIGNNFGPRAYMTILGIKALREYNYLCKELGADQNELVQNEELANSLNSNLINKLWDDDLNYLISYFNDGSMDKHIYMGSLLAVHFDELSKEKNNKLLTTAANNLLDEKIGIYTLYPMDLHLLKDYMGFAGNEAGDPYYYLNGGIWPAGNAWYALGLIKNNKKAEALEFIKTTMTLDGVMDSPNGQPAMYEYRISDKNNPEVYGMVDKPQFMWAAGWYLYSLYNLFGINENDWNISFDPYIPAHLDKLKIPLLVKKESIDVNISGKGEYVSSIKYDGIELQSVVVPFDEKIERSIDIKLGNLKKPYLNFVNAKVSSVKYLKKVKSLKFDLTSFSKHKINLEVISPFMVDNIRINDKAVENYLIEKVEDHYSISIKHIASKESEKYEIKFK